MADGSANDTYWYSSAELAGMPGLPGTARGILKLAIGANWPSRPRRKGKGNEYPFTALPAPTQTALRTARAVAAANAATSAAYREGQAIGRRQVLAETVDAAAVQRQREQGTAKAAALSGHGRARMDARAAVLAALDAFARATATAPSVATAAFAIAYNRGEIELDAAHRAQIGLTLSAATVRRWHQAMRSAGLAALAGSYGNRAGAGAIDAHSGLRDLAVGLIAARPHINGRQLYRALHARLPEATPHLRSVQRFLDRWKAANAQAFLAVSNPDAWKNQHMVAFGKVDEAVERLNQRWELDATPADLLLTDGRHVLVGVIDVWSRRLLLRVSKSSSAEAQCHLLRRAVLAWGAPELAKMDNGADYVSRRYQSALLALDIQIALSAPFSPWEKPHIERAFRTFSHDLVELLPGYIGHNVADAQALRARQSFAEQLFAKNASVELRMSADELQSFCDRWCASIYEHEPRQGLGGLTVFARVASYTGAVRRIADERALDLLLADLPSNAGGRTVGKKGIRVDGHLFIAPELGALVKAAVQVKYDPDDLGRIVVYHDHSFICVAQCPELLGISRQEVAVRSKALQKEQVAAARAELRALARKVKADEVVEDILAARERDTQTLAAFPAPNVVHLTPALDAAAEAARALESRPAPPPLDLKREYEALTEIRDLRRADQAEDDTAEKRFFELLRVMRTPEVERNDIDRQRLKNYFDTPEFRGRWMVFESFGPSAFGLPEEYIDLLGDGAFAYRYRDAQLKGTF